jgi:3'-5' exoribonuclease
MKRLNDIKGPGENFLGFALIRNATVGQTQKQSSFLTLELVDNDSSIEAKLWDSSEEDAFLFTAEKLVKVQGKVDEYRGQLQLKIEKIRIVEERDEVTIEEFIPRAPEETDEMVKEFEGVLSSIGTPILKEITERLYYKNKEKFIIQPAASKNHHNYWSGLLYHCLSMSRQARYFATQYKMLNVDLLLSGIALHDIGKVEEISNPISPSYTRKRLVGHIALGMMWIDREVQAMKAEGRVITEEEEELIDELLHLVGSHHGDVSLGWGSVVTPMTLEARFLHQIDKTDADHEMIRAGLEGKEEGEFHKIWPVGNFLKK